ncbi:MAG: hypothetical protein Q9220_005870 [cf. Caloplaca sp. 1 TL-2023]
MPHTTPSDLKAWDLPIGITSLSLGRASVHGMQDKVRAAADAGFKGIEIFYEDLESLARELRGIDGNEEEKDLDESSLREAARSIRHLCNSFEMSIINLQPFRDYEGLLNRDHHVQKIAELKTWLGLCHILRTDMIVLTSVFPIPTPVATGDDSIIISDLREVADLGAQAKPPIRFAYEPISWGAHINTWQRAYSLIQEANRPNLGLCLDTFHILAKLWADPESPSGRRRRQEVAPDALLRQDLQELINVVTADKLFSVQLADAAKLDPPLSAQHPWYDPAQHPLMTWSRQARLFPLEAEMGAYLPVLDVLRACVVDIGYEGWISLEVFNASLFARDPQVPILHAQRGMSSWKKCRDALKREMTAPPLLDSQTQMPSVQEMELDPFMPPKLATCYGDEVTSKTATVTTLSVDSSLLPMT